jgi:hypothetical protein
VEGIIHLGLFARNVFCDLAIAWGSTDVVAIVGAMVPEWHVLWYVRGSYDWTGLAVLCWWRCLCWRVCCGACRYGLDANTTHTDDRVVDHGWRWIQQPCISTKHHGTVNEISFSTAAAVAASKYSLIISYLSSQERHCVILVRRLSWRGSKCGRIKYSLHQTS